MSGTRRKVPLPDAVAKIYEAVAELEKRYPGRKFTPDGHLVGSIREVIAAETLRLALLPMSAKDHDAADELGVQVQIKLTSTSRVSMYGPSDRLVVLRIVDPHHALVEYDGDGHAPWDACGPMGKNGQRCTTKPVEDFGRRSAR